MNQIGLFSKGGTESQQKRLNSKRPEQISVSRVHSQNQKWKECKIIGKNISIRSYSSCCVFNDKFYIYGGYQILNGMMNDFYSINVEDSEKNFVWELLEQKGKTPGVRSKHALIGGKSKIYLIGGLCDNIFSSNEIFAYDPETKIWEQLKPDGQQLPHIDSFAYAYFNSGEQQKVVILCGYDGEKAEYLNSVYEYNISRNKLVILYAGSQEASPDIPIPRSGASATIDPNNGDTVYLFGGKDAENRMKDLWAFSLNTKKYVQLKGEGDYPNERNGHTMEFYDNKLYIFGGIHDITWELDDLQVYDIQRNKWTTVQEDSPRKIQKKQQSVQKQAQKGNEKKSPKKKNWYDTVNSMYQNRSSPENSPTNIKKNFSTAYREEDNLNPHSPGKMIDEQRKKAFLHRKAEMLKNFEVEKDEKEQLVKLETSSQAMKNSLDVIGNPDPKNKVPEGRLTDFGKQTTSKFLEPLSNNSNLIVGKKPCARDGHCSTILKGELIIFGGDRHQMSFNDIYKLDLNLAMKEIK